MKSSLHNYWLILLPLFFLFSCSNKVFEEHKELSANMTWPSNIAKHFDVLIEKEGDYQMSLALRYVTGFPFKQIELSVAHSSETEKQTKKNYLITVANEEGDYLGDPGLDIWDLSQVVEKSIHLSKGKHEFIISHNAPIEPLTHVMEVGLILDKAD